MALQMNPNSIAGRCLAIVQEGPATTREVAAELGMDSHKVGTHMANLHKRGKVQRQAFVQPPAHAGRVNVWLWSAAA